MLIDDLWVQSPDPECGDLLVTVPSRGKLFSPTMISQQISVHYDS